MACFVDEGGSMVPAKWDELLIAEVLQGACERVQRGWAVGHQARTRAGEPVAPEHPRAASWCAFGAIRAECLGRFPVDRRTALELAEVIARYLGAVLKGLGQPVVKQSASRTVMEWNDLHAGDKDVVLDVYRRTAAALRRRHDAPGPSR